MTSIIIQEQNMLNEPVFFEDIQQCYIDAWDIFTSLDNDISEIPNSTEDPSLSNFYHNP